MASQKDFADIDKENIKAGYIKTCTRSRLIPRHTDEIQQATLPKLADRNKQK